MPLRLFDRLMIILTCQLLHILHQACGPGVIMGLMRIINVYHNLIRTIPCLSAHGIMKQPQEPSLGNRQQFWGHTQKQQSVSSLSSNLREHRIRQTCQQLGIWFLELEQAYKPCLQNLRTYKPCLWEYGSTQAKPTGIWEHTNHAYRICGYTSHTYGNLGAHSPRHSWINFGKSCLNLKGITIVLGIVDKDYSRKIKAPMSLREVCWQGMFSRSIAVTTVWPHEPKKFRNRNPGGWKYRKVSHHVVKAHFKGTTLFNSLLKW